MFSRLRRKMLWFNLAVTAFVMVAAFVAIYTVTYINIQKDIDRRLAEVFPSALLMTRANGLPGEWNPSGEIGLPGEIVSGRLPVGYKPSFAFIMDSNGRLVEIYSPLDFPIDTYYQAAEQAWEDRNGTINLNGRKWQYSTVRVTARTVSRDGIMFNIDNGFYQAAFLDVTTEKATLKRLTITFIVVGILMMGVLFAISLYFARRSVRPLEVSWEKQKQFVADASHELKTPLAIISANIDAIEAGGEETVNSQKEWLGYIRAELRRLNGLVGDLLYLAKSEDARQDQLLPFSLNHVVDTAIASMEALIYEKDIVLKTDLTQTPIFVHGDEEKIKQALLILIDNAAKYTPRQGTITVTLTYVGHLRNEESLISKGALTSEGPLRNEGSLTSEGSLGKLKGRALVRVANTGPGIAPEDLPRIFDRFYRPDDSRSHDSGGYGLGLAIAKTIVERAGGEITAQSILGVTTFSVVLRRAPQEKLSV